MANSGVAPVNLGSNVGLVRVLLGDTDPTNVVGTIGEYLYFSDAEVESLLGMYEDNPKLAAARALEAIAGSQALLLKSWSTDDLNVRGDQIAKELRDIAKQLRSEALASDSSSLFDVVAFGEEDPEYSWWN
jgi:hypothetical protein